MTSTKLFKLFCLSCLGLGFWACDGSDSYTDKPLSVKVLSVEAHTNFDLSARKDWRFLVHGRPYAFDIAGGKITAAPTSESNTYAFSVTVNDRVGRAVITFMPKDYLKTRQESSVTIPPSLQDQSTPEKFMACDVLRSDFYGEAAEELSVTFFHENALLLFKTEGFPEDTKIYIKQLYGQKITPLQDKNNPTAYRALIFPENYPRHLTVVVETAGKIYERTMDDIPFTRQNISYPSGIGHSAIVEFTAERSEEDQLLIKNLQWTPFTRKWPITQ